MRYVYVIQAGTNGSYYIGSSHNVKERLKRHNEGRSPYTKSKGNWRLVYVEEYETSGEATAREKEIKGKKSRKYIEYLVRPSPAFGGGRSRVRVSSAPCTYPGIR
jgi:putative endonuclease